jgi:hypothetical protein
MTLVARFEVSDVIVLISDALLSTEDPLQAAPIAIPSVRTSEKHHGDAPTTMAGLVQKMTVIGKTAVLCFAGRYSLGQEVLSYLKNRLEEGMHPATAWDKMRMHYSLNNYSDLELVFEAMHPVGEGKLQLISKSIGLKGSKEKYRSFGEAVFAGSGAELAQHVLSRGDHGPSQELEGKYERAVQRGLHVVAELLDLDMRSGASFDNHFGGAYEIAIWYGNRFKKIDGIQFVYWTINLGEEANALTLDRILLQYYEGDTLCVDEILVDDSTPEKISLRNEQRLPISNVLNHRIPSLSQGHEAREFEVGSQTDFRHRLTVHCCRLSDETGFFSTGTIISGTIQSEIDSSTVSVTNTEVILTKDIGQFLKDHLVAAMEGYGKEWGRDREASPNRSILERIKALWR